MIRFFKSKFEVARSSNLAIRRFAAIAFVVFGFACIFLAATFLILENHLYLGADVTEPAVTTCDDYASWEEANSHFNELAEHSPGSRNLDTNNNGIPCEGLMPRSRHPSEDFDVVCDDFQHRDEAEYFFETYESPGLNRYGLDRDLDGRPCEAVPPLDDINRVLSRLNRLWHDESQIGGDADCDDFESWGEANAFFIRAGGPESDPHRLDGDSNGVPCEALPGAP